MRKHYCFNSLVLVLLTLTGGCEDTFIPDPLDPRLSKYTEEGRGAAGAFINDDVWSCVDTLAFPVSTHKSTLNIYEGKDSMILTFSGVSGVCTCIEFNLSGLHVYSLEDLKVLEDKKIPLDGTTNAAICRKSECWSDNPVLVSDQTGQLWIRNVAIVDSSEAILSGTFGFDVNQQNEHIKVTYGRFDFRYEKDSNFGINQAQSSMLSEGS
jgi:hypothetical protein